MNTQEEEFVETVKEIQPNSKYKSNFREKYTIKLWIADILCLQKHKEVEGAYDFNGTVVRTVDIFGIITNIRVFKNRRTLYKVDDGTGEIWCFQDLGKYQDEIESIIKNCADDPSFPCSNNSISTDSSIFFLEESTPDLQTDVSEWLQKQLVEAVPEFRKPREVGETVHVIGKLNEYREEAEIVIYNIRPVRSLCHEVDRLYEILYLYRKHYDKLGDQKKGKLLSKCELKELLSARNKSCDETPGHIQHEKHVC